MNRRIAIVAIAAAILSAMLLHAQVAQTFKARLSPVPIEAAMRNTVTGKGAAAASLTGSRLSITGSFEGLQGPATVARLHMGRVTGVRGPVIAELEAVQAVSGSIRGTLSLTPEQVEGLRKGRLYVQIHSEKAPEGNLWGWLLR